MHGQISSKFVVKPIEGLLQNENINIYKVQKNSAVNLLWNAVILIYIFQQRFYKNISINSQISLHLVINICTHFTPSNIESYSLLGIIFRYTFKSKKPPVNVNIALFFLLQTMKHEKTPPQPPPFYTFSGQQNAQISF